MDEATSSTDDCAGDVAIPMMRGRNAANTNFGIFTSFGIDCLVKNKWILNRAPGNFRKCGSTYCAAAFENEE